MFNLLKKFTILALLISVIPTLSLASNKVTIGPNDVIFTKIYKDKSFSCLQQENTFHFGKPIKNNTKFKKLTKKTKKKITSLIEKIKRESDPKKLKKLKRKRKNLKKALKAKRKLCKQGPDPRNLIPDEYSLEPLERAITEVDLRYLTEKAGLGGIQESVIDAGLAQGLAAAVNDFMSIKPEPEGLDYFILDLADGQLNNDDDFLRGLGTRSLSDRGLREGWTYRLAQTNNPYKERFALFLLNLWTVNIDVLSVDQKYLMWNYFEKLRTAAENTNALELAINLTRDPHMLIFLDGDKNVKGGPNENYARELLELFTVGTVNFDGAPNYTEEGDIVQIARALTGWKVARIDLDGNGSKWQSLFSEDLHDRGPKTIFAGTSYETNVANDEDVVRAIFNKHPHTANYYAQEILNEYLVSKPPKELIVNFASVIKENNFNLTAAMKVLFNSKAFYHPAYKNSIPKSSLEVFAHFVRALEIPFNARNVSDHLFAQMATSIINAPSVFGWDESTWISPSVNLGTMNLISAKILNNLNAQNRDDEDPNDNWLPEHACPSGENISTQETLSHIEKRLNITVPASMFEQIDFYMNNKLNSSGTYSEVTYNSLDSTLVRRKCLGLYYILSMTPDFLSK